ncbi:MAG: DUF3892 domain-containing protein [Vitreimonas sp.]
MASLQITCITPDGRDADQRIDAVGGSGFYHLIDDAIRFIENRTHSYWTMVNGRATDVVVATRHNGRKYLKTVADGYEPNNLLALRGCQ